MAQVLAFTPFVAITALIPLAAATALRMWPAAAVAMLAALALLITHELPDTDHKAVYGELVLPAG